MDKGYKGISFPFRFNGRGGVATSTTGVDNFDHIRESLIQIVKTSLGERVNEVEWGSEIGSVIFEPMDELQNQSILKLYVQEAIARHEPRVELIESEVRAEETTLYVTLIYRVSKYLKTDALTVEIDKTIGEGIV